jgi:hypothetical protein
MFIEKAKQLISEFCLEEYNSDADFSNLEKISLAFTNTEDEEHDLQVEADLIHKELHYFVNNKLVNTEKYNEEDMLGVFSCMTFDDLTDLYYFRLEYDE